jgi:hypothetical protein
MFSELFMAYLLTRNSWIEEDLIDQLFNSSEKRLARLLLLLAHFGKKAAHQSTHRSAQRSGHLYFANPTFSTRVPKRQFSGILRRKGESDQCVGVRNRV